MSTRKKMNQERETRTTEIGWLLILLVVICSPTPAGFLSQPFPCSLPFCTSNRLRSFVFQHDCLLQGGSCSPLGLEMFGGDPPPLFSPTCFRILAHQSWLTSISFTDESHSRGICFQPLPLFVFSCRGVGSSSVLRFSSATGICCNPAHQTGIGGHPPLVREHLPRMHLPRPLTQPALSSHDIQRRAA